MLHSTEISVAEYQAGNYHRAIQFARYALARDDENAAAWRCLARALVQTYSIVAAIDAFENAALLQPLEPQDSISLAIAYGAAGRRGLSRDLLMTVANSDSIDVEGLLQVATGLEALDEPRLAMEACRRAGKLAPDSAQVHYQMGYYAQLAGQPVSIGEALVRHAINLEPRNLHYRIGLASMLIRLGRKCEAIAVIDHLIPKQLHEVSCLCCLKRIANLFFDGDDLHRARLCAQRIAELTAAASEKGHSPDATVMQ
ncbi:tetratricopeptide repeat protein [Rosistilla oblonga]|uniref:Anaphase-promoting complex, cyclosome, subunit 3 n=1 Tax=Rosistilla oblonga TaxID=2527990 RepID=A0A518IXR7_9BACT|nr:hypothetical protein [Rosistilla oblonga]QDV57878.1 Anaphase-promoting complex, cyclosome, subunit 3 [Rosistilla oblonga]